MFAKSRFDMNKCALSTHIIMWPIRKAF